MGQVLGENWRDLGFDSPKALLDEAMDGVKGQVRLMHRFITFNGLADELMHHLWEGFARIYNGAGFRKNEYHAKLRKAYERIAGKPSPHTPHPAVLRVGARGAEVKRLQTALRKAGFFLTVDGDFGPATRRVVEAFQALEGLEPDGVVGARTWARLEARVKDG